MNLLCDTYIFYADVYFIQNFLIKFTVLYLSLYCNKLHFSLATIKGIGKIVLASFLGTMVEIAGLFLGNSYNVFLVLVHLFELPCMMLLVLGKHRHNFIKVIVTGYFFVMVVNGALEIFWNWFGEQGNYVFYLCVACGGVYAGVRIWKNYTQIQKGIFPVELQHGGRQMASFGFYDSGNRLMDPYTGKGVHIISDKLIKQLLMEKQKEVYIPFQSLGNEQGLIKVYYLEYIRIQNEQNFIEETEVPVGVAEECLFEGKQYEVILNERIW